MKRCLLAASIMLAALVACQKNMSDTADKLPAANPVKITLTATIGADTKITYIDEDNVLKTAWEQYDKVSLLAVDVSGNLISNDVFTATSAGKTAEFDGTFTNDPATAAVWVYYPALTEGAGTEVSKYRVPAPDSYNSNGVLYGSYIGASYISIGTSYNLQKHNNDPSDLTQYAVMNGKADMDLLSEGIMSVNLAHKSYVIKATVTYPDNALTVNNLMLKFTHDTRVMCVGIGGWTYIRELELNPGNYTETTPYICFGEDISGGTGTGITLEGNTIVAYIPLYAGEYNDPKNGRLWTNIKAGDMLSITSSTSSGDYVIKDIEFTKDIMIENGKMYRLSASLEAAAE